jgi:hypothetical protein
MAERREMVRHSLNGLNYRNIAIGRLQHMTPASPLSSTTDCSKCAFRANRSNVAMISTARRVR